MTRHWMRVSLGLCLAACGGDGGDDFLVPGYETLLAQPAATECTTEDFQSDGVIDQRTKFVAEGGGATWRYEVRGRDGELTSHSLYHFDHGGRILDSEETIGDGPAWRCYWAYDSFGRELSMDCDYDGDGVSDDVQRTLTWSDAGGITSATLRDLGREYVVTRAYDQRGRVISDENRAVDDGTVSWDLTVSYDDAARTRTAEATSDGSTSRLVTRYDDRGHKLFQQLTKVGGDPNMDGWTKELVWNGDELERTVQLFASGRKSTTVYSDDCD